MKKKEEPAWESLIGAKIEAHRGTYKPQRIEDSRKRNAFFADYRSPAKSGNGSPGLQLETTVRNHTHALLSQ